MNMKQIRDAIEKCLYAKKKIAIYPLGMVGMQTKLIMKELYDIEPVYLFDNNLCNYNKQVLPITALEKIDYRDIMLIFTMKSDNSLYTKLLSYLEILEISIVEIKWNSTIAVQGGGREIYIW